MKKMMLTLGAAAICGAVGADNLITNGGAENKIDWFTGFSGKLTKLVRSGKSCYFVNGQKQIYGKQFIPVDPTKAYELSGWMKSTGDVSSKAYLGVIPFDAQKRQISIESVYNVPKTETVLAADVAKGAKQIKIKDGKNWKKGRVYCIAFKTKKDLSDLPNRNLSRTNVTALEKAGDVTVVTFATPLNKAYKAGTPVREHRAGATFIYTACAGKTVPEIWTKFSGKISGEQKSGNTPSNRFRVSTKFVKIVMLANYGTPKGRLAIDDLEFKEVAKK
jgi:hypothetical protein